MVARPVQDPSHASNGKKAGENTAKARDAAGGEDHPCRPSAAAPYHNARIGDLAAIAQLLIRGHAPLGSICPGRGGPWSSKGECPSANTP